MASPKSKKIKAIVKLNLPAGSATPAPPVGSVLGQHGVAIMEFVKAYNDKTSDQKGSIIPAVITIYEDRSFSFITKLPPATVLIKKALGIDKGAKKTGRENIASLTAEQLTQIAEQKMNDLNTTNIEAAKNIIAGSAKSMGIKIN